MDRRRFLQLLGIAPLAFNAHRVYFDMGRSLWRVAPDGLIYHPAPIAPVVDILDQLNAVTQKLLDAQLTADGWPDIADVRKWQAHPEAIRVHTKHTPTGLGIIIP